MTTAFFSHAACLAHQAGQNHPERPARLAAILQALDGDDFEKLDRREAPISDAAALELAHPAEFVDWVLTEISGDQTVRLDPDTAAGPGSKEAALRAVGAVCAAVDAVVAGEVRNAFCAVRPPGHHAEPTRSMGFCLFNNIAIAAHHARETHGIERVAVIDFDVHHGNGTQAMFETDKDLFYASTHQWPLYPGTGATTETGVGNIVNATLAPGAGSVEFRRAFDDRIVPALRGFAPELVLVSAGFDAHRNDPLAQLELETEDYAWVTQRLLDLADACAGGRLVSTLEGGYDLDARAASTSAHVGALMAP